MPCLVVGTLCSLPFALCALSLPKTKLPAKINSTGSLRFDFTLHSWVVFNDDFSRVVLTINRQLNLVSAGFKRQAEVESSETATTTATTAAAAAAATAAAAAATTATAATAARAERRDRGVD